MLNRQLVVVEQLIEVPSGGHKFGPPKSKAGVRRVALPQDAGREGAPAGGGRARPGPASMSRYDLPDEITLTFEEARVIYLALVHAEEAVATGSELRIRLHDCAALVAHKLAPDLGDLT